MNTPKLILAECRNWFEDVHPLRNGRNTFHGAGAPYPK
jgi:hypothetical protein